MSDFSHSLKKRLSRATTRTKTLEAGMSAAYTSEKHTILREKATLERMLAMTTSARSAWVDLAKAHKIAAEAVSGDAAVDGPFYAHAGDAAAGANAMMAHASAPPPTSGEAVRIEGHVRAYLAEVDQVVAKFGDVEAGYAEVSRYERKVGKLSDRAARFELKADKAAKVDAKAAKSAKAEKVADRTRRNIDKLEGERAAYQSKLDGVIADMRRTSAKYDVVLQCAHVAFWLLQEEAIGELGKNSASATDYALSVRDALVELDVSGDVGGFDPADPESQGVLMIESGTATDSETTTAAEAGTTASEPMTERAADVEVQ